MEMVMPGFRKRARPALHAIFARNVRRLPARGQALRFARRLAVAIILLCVAGGAAKAGPAGVYHSFIGLNSPLGYLPESVAFSREQSCQQIYARVERENRRRGFVRYWSQYLGIIDGTCRYKAAADGGGFTDQQCANYLAACVAQPPEPGPFNCTVSQPLAFTPLSPAENVSGIASRVCLGDPVDPATGNMTQDETDYEGPGPFPLRFARTYSSLGRFPNTSPLGLHWRHSYERYLVLSEAGDNAAVYGPDNRFELFSLVGTQWQPSAESASRLERNPGSGHFAYQPMRANQTWITLTASRAQARAAATGPKSLAPTR
jgi:hypothetical protein